MKNLLVAASVALTIPCTLLPGGEPQCSRLWGAEGELWTPYSRLPDFSHAGYHEGDDPLPRVPFIVRCPGRVRAGAVNESVTVNTDIYPTILDLVGLPPAPEQHIDGISMGPALRSGATMPFDRSFHWVYDINHTLGHRASIGIRRGDYKLIYWLKDGHTELYNVVEDIGEDHDLSTTQPETVNALLTKLKQTAYVWRYSRKEQ